MVHHIDRRSGLMLFTKHKENCLECNSRHGRSVTSKPLFDQLEKHRAYYTPQKDPGTQGSCQLPRLHPGEGHQGRPQLCPQQVDGRRVPEEGGCRNGLLRSPCPLGFWPILAHYLAVRGPLAVHLRGALRPILPPCSVPETPPAHHTRRYRGCAVPVCSTCIIEGCGQQQGGAWLDPPLPPSRGFRPRAWPKGPATSNRT